MSLKWDYKNRTYDISMPDYVSNVFSKFQHDAPKHPQQTPSKYVTPVYGAKTQYATQDTPHPEKQCVNIQKVTGSVLYYARAVDPTVLTSLNDIATEQTNATETTQAATNRLMDYLTSRPDATIRYHDSYMILHIHSDASYLSVSNAHSRLSGLFFCGDKPHKMIIPMVPSSMWHQLLKIWWPQRLNQKYERAFTKPKVVPHSELHSHNWATSNC
jgi:hypothetical protein